MKPTQITINITSDQLVVLEEMGYTDPVTAAQDYLDKTLQAGVEELNEKRDKNLLVEIKKDQPLIDQIVLSKNLDPITFEPVVDVNAQAAVDPNAQGV